jgi:hypothetical protein
MSPEILSVLNDLRLRLESLERGRTKRGHRNHGKAADYLGISRETLRQLNLRGKGPARNPDGSYSLDALDAFKANPPPG